MKPENFVKMGAEYITDYYGGCYVKAQHTSDEKMRWYRVLEGINGDDGILVRLVSDQKVSQIEDKVTKFKWDLTFPRAGCHDFRESVVVLTHIPVRSTLKGVYHESLRVFNLLEPFANQFPTKYYQANKWQFSCGCLNLIEHPMPSTFDQRFGALLGKERFAITVNENVALSQGIHSKNPTIWVGVHAVGELNLAKKVAFAPPEFYDELALAFEGTLFQVAC